MMKKEDYRLVPGKELRERTDWEYDVMFYDEEGQYLEHRLEIEEDFKNLKKFEFRQGMVEPGELTLEMKKDMSQQRLLKAKSLKIRGERYLRHAKEWEKEEYPEEAIAAASAFGEHNLKFVIAVESLVMSFDIKSIDEVGCKIDEHGDWVTVCKVKTSEPEEILLQFPGYYEVEEEEAFGSVIRCYQSMRNLKINKAIEF